MDFVPPPEQDNFQTDEEYKKAEKKWKKEFNRALKKYGTESQDEQK